MSKDSSLLLFGGLVILVSFLGIPSSWKTIAFSILGALIITMALLLRKDITTGALCLHLTEEKHTDSYSQNGVLRSNNQESNNSDDSGNETDDNEDNKKEDREESEEENKKEHENDQRHTEPQT